MMKKQGSEPDGRILEEGREEVPKGSGKFLLDEERRARSEGKKKPEEFRGEGFAAKEW